jgi:thiamine phosphate synthase YjbQ (UPF0047 family)
MDITNEVRERVLGADIDEGMVFVNSRHTTCGLLINEFQGALIEDLQALLEQQLQTQRSPVLGLQAGQCVGPFARQSAKPWRGGRRP